jgi:hypothetical protein
MSDLKVGDAITHKYKQDAKKGYIYRFSNSGNEAYIIPHGKTINDKGWATVYFTQNIELDVQFVIEERNKKIDKLCQEKYNSN